MGVDFTKEKRIIEAIWEQLSAFEQEMLTMLSFHRGPIPGYRIASISQLIARHHGKTKGIQRSGVSSIGQRLQDEGLVDHFNGQWQIKPELAWVVVRYFVLDQDEIAFYERFLNQELPFYYMSLQREGDEHIFLRMLQFSLLLGESFQFSSILRQLEQRQPEGKGAIQWLEYFLGDPIDMELLDRQRPAFKAKVLINLVGLYTQDLRSPVALMQALYTLVEKNKRGSEPSLKLDEELLSLEVLVGNPGTWRQLALSEDRINVPGTAELLEGVGAFWRDDRELAAKKLHAASRKRKFRSLFPDFTGVYHSLLHLINRDFERVDVYCQRTDAYLQPKQIFLAVAYFLENNLSGSREVIDSLPRRHMLSDLFLLLASYWCDYPIDQSQIYDIKNWLQGENSDAYPCFALIAAELMAFFAPPEEQAQFEARVQALLKKYEFKRILPRIPRYEAWERTLEGLVDLALKNGSGSNERDREARLTWRISFDQYSLTAFEQKIRKAGGWTKGRKVSLKRIKEEFDSVTSLTPQDQLVAKHIQRYGGGWYSGAAEYEINFFPALKELVGHPLLFLEENPSLAVELIHVEPELIITETPQGYSLSVEPSFDHAGIHLIKETSTRYRVMEVSLAQEKMANLIGAGNIRIPKAGEARLKEILSGISQVIRIQSDLVGQSEDLKVLEADPRLYILLVPVGEDFKVEVFSKPLGSFPPYLKPGKGREQLLAEIEGERVRTQRNLVGEKEAAEALIKACPTLERNPNFDWEWYLESTESCLELLLELDILRQKDQIVIEWPKGEKLKLAGQVNFENLKVKVGGNQNWFKLDGEVQVNEDEILSLQLLLKAIREGGESQFVTLDDGRYLALTDQLRKQLKDLAAFSQEKRGQVGLHPLMAEGLEALGEQGAQLKVNAAWKRQIKQLKEARTYQPRLPQNLQADLRPYQEEGYHWMARLAQWGVGACLADDMGLGKTVQALAMLLSRGGNGPSLVVAPASVVRNWRKEADKFAPELNPILLGESARAETIAELKPYDLLLTSYNLMQIEIEHLSTVNFSMVVLDEAQAIKNTQAKRSKAAKTLQAQFKLITTGTPIENHLGEIWNLFDFLNPGLLGSMEHFNSRYAIPIERDQDAERKSQLRKLLRPFILRRRKSEVLEELPEKTEITLSVELSESERAFYEALRRNALSSLAKAEGDNPGEQRMKILAEITRLRQAACHPGLVAPEMELGSSKLKLFGEVLSELRENGHKALVFSQFVKYLKLVEAYVDEQGISYQYLDGQTPMKQREKRVEAFQRGQGDVFLISLKAGGVGLNLTAADYVIHMDPWWNPAVEDQASDRAHRIGQQRPVTVYRLVAEQTIEEKIVRLHQRKRDLADSLLEGTDRGGKLSSEELMALISEA